MLPKNRTILFYTSIEHPIYECDWCQQDVVDNVNYKQSDNIVDVVRVIKNIVKSGGRCDWSGILQPVKNVKLFKLTEQPLPGIDLDTLFKRTKYECESEKLKDEQNRLRKQLLKVEEDLSKISIMP